MRKILLALIIVSIYATTPACKKEKSSFSSNICNGDCLTQTGIISEQGITTYQYGSHILTTDDGSEFVLTSDVVDLDKRVGQKCIVILKDLHFTVSGGPNLYNVTVIRPAL